MTTESMYQEIGIRPEVLKFGTKIEKSLKERFDRIDETAEYNQLKVIHAMQKNRVCAECFNQSSGYGYNDLGRETLEAVYASVFHTESALVRPQITCGTHALALALSSNLRPGDELLSISGKPYDTLEEVIGIRPSMGSLKEYGVSYSQVDLKPDGSFDFEKIREAIKPHTRLIAIQRSKGYQTRPTLSVEKIGEAIAFVKGIRKDLIVMVDNCYGEFTQKQEPTQRGADLMAGSLIKNPGGGIAPTGGYIAGRADLVELCAHRLSAPGVGGEIGCTLDMLRGMYLGLYYAPGVVCEALKTSVYAACLFELLGYAATPAYGAQRNDIITSVETGSPEGMVALCGGVQAGSPVDSFAAPEPGDMPGYEDPVIMAAGAFTMGSSIELSADGPLRAPYTVYMQGGLNFAAARAGVLLGADRMLRLRRSE